MAKSWLRAVKTQESSSVIARPGTGWSRAGLWDPRPARRSRRALGSRDRRCRAVACTSLGPCPPRAAPVSLRRAPRCLSQRSCSSKPARGARSRSRPVRTGSCDERVDRFRRALEDRFDPAVGQVAHYPTQTGSLGPPGAGHAVAHALHPTLDDDPPADHPAQDTRRDAAAVVQEVPRASRASGGPEPATAAVAKSARVSSSNRSSERSRSSPITPLPSRERTNSCTNSGLPPVRACSATASTDAVVSAAASWRTAATSSPPSCTSRDTRGNPSSGACPARDRGTTSTLGCVPAWSQRWSQTTVDHRQRRGTDIRREPFATSENGDGVPQRATADHES
jgi:hypothetical protein